MKYTALLFALFLSGCIIADSSHVLVGQARPAIDISQVKVYSNPPKQFEEIALIESTAAHDFQSDQALVDEAIRRLKMEAASLGANGVLIATVGSESGSSNTVYVPAGNGYGTFITDTSKGKVAKGKAIYVAEE
ncbi:hypothetical protein [Microbulbifer sp. HZ11]|uniref:hypothetical protein n=1 Tax=Microbulbifer sp. HZ11 TaxID=1453501 RepID=UPI0005B821AE|nr:hypothetical protein [Microbulbifer sp. HZ11]